MSQQGLHPHIPSNFAFQTAPPGSIILEVNHDFEENSMFNLPQGAITNFYQALKDMNKYIFNVLKHFKVSPVCYLLV